MRDMILDELLRWRLEMQMSEIILYVEWCWFSRDRIRLEPVRN